MSGNTMGAFDPLAEVRYLAQCMKPGDRLILDGEIFQEQKTLAMRSNPAARKFVWTLLGCVGIGEDDGEVRFDLKRDERHDGLRLITRHFRASRDITATVAGEAMELQRGERIGLNFVYVYTPEAFRWLLTEQGGLEIESEYLSSDGRFVTAVCRK